MRPLFLEARKQCSQPLLHRLLLLLLALTTTAGPAAAQSYRAALADTTQVFSFAEQMPALPDGGGNLALVKAVQKLVQLPAEVREGRTEGRVYVRVVIGVSGVARQAAVVQKLSPACDAAAFTAVRHLPRLLPGRYNVNQWPYCSITTY